MSRPPKYLERALMVVLSVALVLGVVEVGLRLSHSAPLPDAAAGGFRPEHPLLRLLRPHECNDAGSLAGPFSVEVCTNEYGLRDRDHMDGESPRVLGIGDSFTFGWGVEQNDTFLARLERSLRLGLPEVRPGVFKAGLSYTSQVHEDVLLRYLYDKVRPDLVVLAFSEDNDIDENIIWNPNLGVFPERGEIPKTEVTAFRDGLRGVVVQDYLFRHSALVRFFRQRHLRASLAAEAAALDSRLEAHGFTGAPLSRMVADEARRRFLQAFSHKFDDDWRLTEILLERLERYVAERGAKFVLLRIPSRMSVEDPAWESARTRFCGADAKTAEAACGTLDRDFTARRLATHAKAHGLIYVDPGSDLRAGAERGETLYIPEDIHLSQLGHARVAASLAETVVPMVGGKAPEKSAAPETPPKQRRVGAYWYPWYRTKDWPEFTDYTPKGGTYVSDEDDAIQRQLQQAERAEIDFLIIEGLADHNPESVFNNKAVDKMVRALVERRRRGLSHLEFAILSDIYVGDADIGTNERWLDANRKHLDQIWTRFVEPFRDAYFHVDGKPLLGVFSPPVPVDDPRFTMLRPYWVSHEQWKDWDRKKDLVPFWDTVPQMVTDERFVSVTPGYNDWRLERRPQVGPYLPRLGGRTFVDQWRRVFEADPAIVLVYSFNEFFEQSQIQPTVEQGDRYLVLNQILARRFKDGRSLSEHDAERLADVIEPRPNKKEEKVAWLAIGDPRMTTRGLEPESPGRLVMRDEAELEFDVDAEEAFLVGVGHGPSFEHCAGLQVTVSGGGSDKTESFPTELTQLSILRDSPVSKSAEHMKIKVKRVPAAADCKNAGSRPIALTGVTRYPLSTAERVNFRVDDPNVRLSGFWDIETPPSGSFSWTHERATVTLSRLAPGVHHLVTLIFRDTAGFTTMEVGPDPEHLKTAAISALGTVKCPDPFVVAPDGTLTIAMKTQTWRPHERFGSEDSRTLGMALRLVTLDRQEGVKPPHERR